MKSVINLVRELGVKTAEVLELLRQVGVDTEAEGFSMMSKVDDETVAKLHELRKGNGAAKPRPARRRKAVEEPEQFDLSKGGLTASKSAGKDFFGVRAKPEKPPEEQKSTRKEVKAPAARQQKAATEAPSRPAPAKAGAKPAGKPDLSGGPKIISMPDPKEAAVRRRERVEGGETDDSSGAADKRRGRGDKRKKGTEKEDYGAGRRRKLKEIGVFDEEGHVRSRKRVFKVSGKSAEPLNAVVPHIKITGEAMLREVAKQTGVKVPDIVRFLMKDLGIMANINYVASVEEIQLIADHFDIKHTLALEQVPEGELQQFEEVVEEKQVERPPVVTIMGHVDHGKTKLLDTIRTSNVVAGEAGGITQHIGAYQVENKGKRITFLDTPGHEAFTAMRARGSMVTDIVVLVVAADDGVMPQTIEAIEHARSAEVPIIVAVNKIDRPDANPDRVKTQLAERGLTPEDWGGDTIFVNVSALKGENIDELLDMILLSTELVQPKSDPTAPPCGVVVESQVDTGIGVVATVLVQQGTMRKGQFILSGTAIGRIKRMEDEKGQEVSEAGPSTPVRIIGFTDPPDNGDKVYCFMNKKQAQAIAEQRKSDVRRKVAGSSSRMSLEAFFAKAEAGETKDLKLIVKADVAGSAEAIADSLKKLDVAGATCEVISTGVGQINDTDVNLAAAANAVIIGFQVGVSQTAKQLAEREHVDYRMYDIIYKVTEDIELAMKGLLEPVYEKQDIGRAEVRAIFKTSKDGTVAGGYVLDGNIRRNAKFRLRRGQEVLMDEGQLVGLKRFKDDVREVASGFEFGLLIPPVGQDVEEGDILEFYEVVEKARV